MNLLSVFFTFSFCVLFIMKVFTVLIKVYTVFFSGGYRGGQGGMPPRGPRPNFAIAKVCRIQGWKNAILKIHSF